MLEHHDDLTREFPDLKQVVLQLQAKDASFATLLATYRELDKRIYQAESSVEPVGDQTLETWKVERAHCKDTLYQRARAAALA